MTTGQTPRVIEDIPGWFFPLDQRLFTHFLSAGASGIDGDLVELGAYLGKSAVLMGQFRRPHETFTVCDLFGAVPPDQANEAENRKSYTTLTVDGFRRNYLAFHSELPRIIQNVTSVIMEHVEPDSVRFVHVDASHLYEHVATDILSARDMLKEGGVVALDDYRSTHTPGVSAAVWEAVFSHGLVPICLTPTKLYGTFGDSEPHRRHLRRWLALNSDVRNHDQMIADHQVTRLWSSEPTASRQSAPGPKVAARRSMKANRKRIARLERRIALLEAQARPRQRETSGLVNRIMSRIRQR